jgi:aminoglycoside phosphotransferase (APT) family kinase protein
VVSGSFGWLPALIPADAVTFRVTDPLLGEILVDAGGRLVDGEPPDVEITDAGHLSRGAGLEIVMVDPEHQEGGRLLLAAAIRGRETISARLAARRVGKRLRALGYGETVVVLWDIDQFVHLPGRRMTVRRRAAELLPQRALVVGRREDHGPTVLEAVAEEVGRRVGRTVEYGRPLARQGRMVAVADDYVLRIAIGPGRKRIKQHERTLEFLAAAAPRVIKARVPRLLAGGKLGLGEWSAEERLPGRAASHQLGPQLLDDCIDFLVALHHVGPADAGARLLEKAKIVAAACSRTEHRDAVLELGSNLDAELSELPRGFGHGDFWTRNLLVTGGRLGAVIDWDSAAPGSLPLLDLLHLTLSALREKTREYLGEALVRYQLPWAAAGGDEIVDSYCRRLGIDVDARLLKWLVFAYWLEHVAYELDYARDRAGRPVWMRNNVEVVLDSIDDYMPTRSGTRLVT